MIFALNQGMVKAPSGVDPDPVRKKTLDPDLGSMGKKKKLDPYRKHPDFFSGNLEPGPPF